MKRLLPALFYAAIPLFIIGFIFQNRHWPFAGYIILAGLVTHMLMLFMVIKEIIQSKAKDGDKAIWLLLFIGIVFAGLFFFSVIIFWIVLFVIEGAYLFSGRKKITSTEN
jgi:membrane-associated HD superfamily phosphohydrolase